MRSAALCALLLLTGCHAIPIALLTAALGAAAGAERLDDDILNAWLAARGKVAVDKAAAVAPVATGEALNGERDQP